MDRASSMSDQQRDGIGMTSARTRDRLILTLRREGINDPDVLSVIRSVPRHLFVDEALASRAYENTVLPLGHGQTISQPLVVALMTQSLISGQERPLAKVLEIGTGCGYQTAVLAAFARHVYGIERVLPLLKRSKQHLRALRINNVSLRHGDGAQGWVSQAPFQGILVAAAPERIPDALLMQLDDGGRLLIPIGRSGRQSLLSITRQGNEFRREVLGPVSFVPLLEGTAS
jgi:protein-L-isoaspartate(D-aspartate) O-methyltransferase